MVAIDDLVVRPLRPDDIAAACALNAEAGWNQVAADWRYMLDAGDGLAVEAPDGALIATGMVLPYGGRFGWIAMILVTGAWQRRGIASEIMRRCIVRCREAGLVAGLDATEQGRPVYLPLGFRDVYPISRWQTEVVRVSGPVAGVRPLRPDDVETLAAWDAAAFGADRRALLQHLTVRAGGLAHLADANGEIRGYVLARDGRRATQLGPLVAADRETAQALLAAALAHVAGAVFLDGVDVHDWLAAWLQERGFTRQRGYVRMLLDGEAPLDDPARVFLIAGPELG